MMLFWLCMVKGLSVILVIILSLGNVFFNVCIVCCVNVFGL